MNDQSITELTYFRGRVALSAILRGLGIGTGDEVAIQAFTCLAVPEGVMAAGAAPQYVDIEPEGYNMNPGDLAAKLTPRTHAVVVQHTYGIPARLDRILEIAGDAGIPVVEDCCHTFRSSYQGRLVGSFGVASFYSFEWGKPIVVGLGGSAAINDQALRRRVEAAYETYRYPSALRQMKIELQYRAFGLLYRPSLFWPVRWLFHTLSRLGAAEGNYNPIPADGRIAEDFALRMPRRLHCRLTRKIPRVEEHALHSRWLTSQYALQIKSAAVKHPQPPADCDAVYARYPLRAGDKLRLLANARAKNVELAEWYATPVHPLPIEQCGLVGYESGSCPHAERRASEVVTLPTHRRVGRRYLRRVVEFLNSQ